MKDKKEPVPLALIFIVVAIAVIGVVLYFLPPTIQEQYDFECKNIKIFDTMTEDLLSVPKTDKPTIRIFDRGTEDCIRTCKAIRREFDIDFECVAVQYIDEDYLTAVYTYIQGGNLQEDPDSTLLISRDQIRGSLPENNISESEEVTMSGQPIRDYTMTVFFIDGRAFYIPALPSKDVICGVVYHENC